jgi:uncharacterized protein (DUF486 family)
VSAFQLEVMQEALSLVVVVRFANAVPGERMQPNHAVSFALSLAAVAAFH